MRAGDQRLEIRTRPALINLNVGIHDDHANLEYQLDIEAELLTKREEQQQEELAAEAEEVEALMAVDDTDTTDLEPANSEDEDATPLG